MSLPAESLNPELGAEAAIPSPRLEVVQPLSENKARMLGSIVIDDRPQTPFEQIAAASADITIDEPRRFADIMRTSLYSRVTEIRQSGQLRPGETTVNPKLVTRATQAYYLVFYEWKPSAGAERHEALRQRYLRENIALAHADNTKATYPEIRALIQLEARLRDEAGDPAGDVALELLAAYGAAAQPDFSARLMRLLRSTGNEQKNYKLDKH